MREQKHYKLPPPHKAQLKVLKAYLSGIRFLTLICGRRFGKSWIIQTIALLELSKANTRVAYVTPTYELGKTFFNDMLRLFPVDIVASSNITDRTITLINGSFITFYTGEKLDNLRGQKFHLLLVDEAAYIPNLKEGWEGAMSNTLLDYAPNSRAIFVSTPRGKDYFFELTRTNNPDWKNFHFSSYENPHLNKDELAKKKESTPEAVFNQEIMAVAGENASAVVAMKYILENTIDVLSTEPTVVYGIDVAKYSDWTVITGLDVNGKMSYFDRFQSPNEVTKQKIKALPASVLKVVDSTHGSIGDGIYESLLADGVQNLIGFEFTGASKPKLIMEMVLAIEKGLLKFNKITGDELSTFEWKYNHNTGHVKYSAINGCHDDTIAAMAMAFKYLKTVKENTNFLSSFSFF
ncbi:terminase large subunit domain-containing protein [Pedobacter aquatilis]|uniref:terminase large subunit domain-containing protein n=1 Tax=Pedobacter aquatilis TaxID=351343 RepID=UPI00292CEF60|nr:terminase family protein [Pedobacter aquatilis]